MSRIDIREINLLLDTNIPGKEIVPLKKSMIYQPDIKDTGSWNERPYFTSDAEYPESYLASLPYEKQMEFFFNKSKMANILNLYSKASIKAPESANIQTEKQQKEEREKTNELKRREYLATQTEQQKQKQSAEKAIQEAKKNIETKIRNMELEEIKKSDPDFQSASFTSFSDYIAKKSEEIKKKKSDIKQLVDRIKLKTDIIPIFEKHPGFNEDTFLGKLEKDFKDKNAGFFGLGAKEYIPPIKKEEIFDKYGLFSEKFCKLENKPADMKYFKNDATIIKQQWTDYKASLTEPLLATFLTVIKEIPELTDDSVDGICSFMTTVKNAFDKFSFDDAALSSLDNAIQKTKRDVEAKRAEINREAPVVPLPAVPSNPDTTPVIPGLSLAEKSQKEKEDMRSKTSDINIMIMLRLMFPTKYPIIGNVFSSFHSVVTGENEIHLKWTDFIPGFLKKKIFEGKPDYSYLKIDGQTYTVVQAIWQNDIYNHKEYKKLVSQFDELQKWKERQLIKVSADLEKKRKLFRQTYESQLNMDDIVNIEQTKRKNPQTQTEIRYNGAVDALLEVMKELITSIKRSDYKRIGDYSNRFIERINNLRNNYEYRAFFNPQNQQKYDDLAKKMKTEIFNIQADDYILENYLKKEGINLDYKNDPKYRQIMEQRYQVYVKFIDNIRNFRTPLLESTNSYLQNSIDDFANNTEKYKGIFNFLMNPVNVKKNPFSIILPTSPPEEHENIIRESELYQRRLSTGVTIRPNARAGSPYYEIYVQMNLIGGELNDENKSKIDCIYQGETLGDKLSRILNEAIYHPWNINSSRVFFDIEKGETTIDPNKQLPEDKAATASDAALSSGYGNNGYSGGNRSSTKKYRESFIRRFTRRYRY